MPEPTPGNARPTPESGPVESHENGPMLAACVNWQTTAFDEPLTSDIPHLRRICAACPLATTCYRDALADPDAVGFRAGTTEQQRDSIRRTLSGVSLGRRSRFCLACGAPKPTGAGRRYCSATCSRQARQRSQQASAQRRMLRNVGDYATT